MAYKLYINDVLYRGLDDYEIVQQAGATALMDIGIDIESLPVPQPYDKIEITEAGVAIGYTDDTEAEFAEGILIDTQAVTAGLILGYDPLLDGTWNMWAGLTWNDI